MKTFGPIKAFLEGSGSTSIVIAGLFFSYTPVLFADLVDVERANEIARASYIERFTDFTQDKNYMGRAMTPDGTQVLGPFKARFNGDDGLPFQSQLTYHDFSYDVRDEAFEKAAAIAAAAAGAGAGAAGGGVAGAAAAAAAALRSRTLFADVSPHGAIAEANGSSLLERVAYQLHEQYSKEETSEEKKKREEQQGIKFVSLFKVETKEAKKADDSGNSAPPPGSGAGSGKPGPGGAGANSAKKDDKIERVERWTMRPEAEAKIADVGTKSFDTIEKSARDPDKKEDSNAMGNLLFFYQAANAALKSMWNSTLANLGQARAFNGIKDKGVGQNIQLSEEIKDCDTWAQRVTAKLAKNDPQAAKNRQEAIQKMVGQCKQMTQTSFRRINPQFEADKNSKEEVLKDLGTQKEEARERDWRVKLETLAKAGLKASEVPSNWQYTDRDDRAKVTTSYDKNGQPDKVSQLTVNEQLDIYNKQLQEASENYEALRTRMGKLNADPNRILSYKIQPKQKRMDQITEIPESSLYEGVEQAVKNQPPPEETYQQLIAKRKR